MKEQQELIKDDDSLPSEEIQEVIGTIPHWFISLGISIFLAIISAILIISWFFKYPDIIRAAITITTENPAAVIVARSSGKIKELFIKDNHKIGKGEPVAIIDNPADYQDVLELKIKLKMLDLNFNKNQKKLYNPFQRSYSLGELQSTYETFLKSYKDYLDFLEIKYHSKKIQALREQIKRLTVYYDQLIRQKKLQEDDSQLIENQYNRSNELFKKGLISENEFETSKSQFIKSKISLDQMNNTIWNVNSQIAQIEESIKEMEYQYIQEKNRLEEDLKNNYENLLSQVSAWEFNYLIVSPIDGIVSFTKIWSVNQNVKAGEQVLTIVPNASLNVIGKVTLPILRSGKVRPGQLVNIKLFEYPHSEFGMIQGIVKSKSLISSDNSYILEISFPQGLTTNYNKKLEFRHEMQGLCEIATDEVSLFWKILNPIRSLIKSRF